LREFKKEARLQVVPGLPTLQEIDAYYHAARLGSRSAAVRQLIKIALSGYFSNDHLQILESIKNDTRPNDFVFPNANVHRIHIALEPSEYDEINDYYKASHRDSRTDAVRRLLEIALSGNLPKEHVTIIDTYIEPRRQIRQLAHIFWEEEGRPIGKDIEHWQRAEAKIAADKAKRAGSEANPKRPYSTRKHNHDQHLVSELHN
jgi:metal-responsive CopG/Arc/MetJ family transcriptional regulator